MKRVSHLVLVVLVVPLIIAAAPTHQRPHPAPTHQRALPVPPIPPAHPPTDGAAPTPNQDAAAPPPVQTSDGLTITPTIVRAPTFHNSFDPSLGYTTGSRWQDNPSADRRLTPSPGFNLQIPFK